MNRRIILASQSPQRKLIFETLGLDFEIIPADIDEKSVEFIDLKSRSENIARTKAEAVIKDNPDAIVIAADTYPVFAGEALEKPGDVNEARQMLKKLSGQSFGAYTGFCYIDPSNAIDQSGVVEIEAVFRKLSDAEIEHYVTTQPVTTWSAGFSPAYNEGAALVAKITGSFTGFTHGLPMEEITSLLIRSGLYKIS